MQIVRVVGASTHGERQALRRVLTIWECGGACSDDLLDCLPHGRVEIHVITLEQQPAIVVIEKSVVGFYPLDDSEPTTIH
jgi:hypothetical protein